MADLINRLRSLYWQSLYLSQKFLRSLTLINHKAWFTCGFCLALLLSCTTVPQVDSFDSADKVLRENFLPKIEIEQAAISDQAAANYTLDPIQEPPLKLEDFPLYGASPSQDPHILYLEIISSSEKGNAKKQDERWLVDVADAFNQKKVKASSGQTIQVGIRNAASGLGSRLITSKVAQPNGYTPTNDLWLERLKDQGVKWQMIQPALLPGNAGFVVRDDTYQELAKSGSVTLDRLLDAIASGKLKIGYPNPYTSSSSLNLLYTLLWQAAGHGQDKQPLTVQDLQNPKISSVFDAFQKQVIVTTVTTQELKDIFTRDRDKLQAVLLDSQSYQSLKQLPGFENIKYIPFGIPQTSPLVGFNWNTPVQQEALKKFAAFATSDAMQKRTTVQPEVLQYLKRKDLPPIPSGEVLTAAQSFWKKRKDGGRTVYMMLVIDTSGSMEGDRIKGVRAGLQTAIQEINPGNQVGLIAFSDKVRVLVPLAPFDTLQHKRLLAAVDSLQADGSTALYDGMAVGLAQLMEHHKTDPNGLFRLLLLSDGERTTGLEFKQIKDILQFSDVRTYPIAYGEVNQQEMQAIASLREATVQSSNPQNVQRLLKEIFQTNL